MPATLGVQVGSAGGSALITAIGGSPQSASTNMAFASPLMATVTSGGNPVSAVPVTFTAPAVGPSGSFAGGSKAATVMTNASGVAVSPTFTANAIPGSYSVLASASGVASPAAFSLTNAGESTLMLSSLTLRAGSEVILPVALSAPVSDGVIVTLTSSNPMILSLSTATLASTANVLIPAGSMSGGIRVVALSPGNVTITAMATGFAPASTQVSVVP